MSKVKNITIIIPLYNEAAVLKVPSSIVPFEYNYLINPIHSDINKIKIIKTSKMSFDLRLKSRIE